ncbi:MAG: NAD(P) transhydrogenase subunit alpha [Candidatus Eremiobacterota bacterium]
MVTLGVLREESDARAALVPEAVARLGKLGIACLVERGAGERAFFPDAEYPEIADRAALLERADILVGIHPRVDPRSGAVLIGLLGDHRPVGANAFALERLPRITRAQSMDVLSSQATVAGYKAALVAAEQSPRFFPMLTTAAGTVPPARVLVLGAGVAGLQAMATARRLGAQVSGYDIRAASREQVQSVGAKFVEPPPLEQAEGAGGYAREQSEQALQRQQEGLRPAVRASEAVICTAAVPGKPAPRLLTRAMLEEMPAGSVVVDLAADTGGNCELTRPGERVRHGGVLVVGDTDLAAQLPIPASKMFARNLTAFLELLVRQGELSIPWEDEIVAACCVARA